MLYCDSGQATGWALGVLALGAGRAGAGRASRARGACVLGVQGARGRQACVGRAGVARRARRRHASGLGAGRWARGLGAWAGQDYALSAPDLIFKPVFDSVFFS